MMSNYSPSGFGDGATAEPLDSVAASFTDENVCGEGASCVVYSMWLDGLHVAVKRLRREHLSNPVYVASYRKEYRIGRRLKHDALPVYRAFREEGVEVYVVMDFVDGVSLEEFIATPEGGTYFSSAENVREFLGQLLDVTGYLHRCGVIHCDLKPANIMLRNSDRRLMIIDLDKAYSDTLDRTHGGTAAISDPLPEGEKPTAQKDFAAIGMILESLNKAVKDFPASPFRKFRKECISGKGGYESLAAALKKRRPFPWSNVAAVVLPLLLIIALWSFSVKSPENIVAAVPSPSDSIIPPAVKDTAANVTEDAGKAVEIPPRAETPDQARPASVTAVQEGKPTLTITPEDVDRGLAAVSREIDRLYPQLRSGGLTNSQIGDITLDLGLLYPEEYRKMRVAFCERYPDMASVDVEMALARAYEKSSVSRRFSEFMQACADTVALRKEKQ